MMGKHVEERRTGQRRREREREREREGENEPFWLKRQASSVKRE